MDRPLKETVYSPDSELLNFGKLMRIRLSICGKSRNNQKNWQALNRSRLV
jgi:hypothetical protein